MKTHFYDIESLSNVFTNCNFKPEENSADIYILAPGFESNLNDPKFKDRLLKAIYDANYNFRGTINIYNLSEVKANVHMAKTFGVSDAKYINDKDIKSNYPKDFRIVCDTDDDFDEEKHPYLMGYNSYNYDTSMLAMYFHEVWHNDIFKPTTPDIIRGYNNDLFLPQFKDQMPLRLTKVYDQANRTWSPSDYNDTRYIIRKNMLMTGRHIDVARLNEKQQKVGLKRILGMLGYQILESDKLRTGADKIENEEQLLSLIAYNMSDCINLEKLFNHKVYKNAFVLKKQLLATYPELIYNKKKDEYHPNISPKDVRSDRLMIDSSSAQFATKTLCPYGHLTDIPVVSFNYPSENKAKELGIPRVNVLDEAKKFFDSHFKGTPAEGKFDTVYNYYKSIEGKNFNDSQNYQEDYQSTDQNAPQMEPAYNLTKIDKADTCLPYFDKNGNPTSCFVTFSTGGIHGAECNIRLFEEDYAEWSKVKADMDYVQSVYPDPIDLKKAKRITMPDGRDLPAGNFLKSGSTLKQSFYKDVDSKKPELFKESDEGNTKLHPKYVYTSSDQANHEDFTSYYPNLLRMMEAFYNEGLGYDRYGEIFEQKSTYGKLMKDETKSKEERAQYDVLRNGVKLILNSASGAGDTNFESNIRMNNQIISMRIIGQLFSWRIGQAQTIHGAKITSTNTDGLYSVLEEDLNNKILEKEAESIHVDIEPEPIFLISKDTNNRIEYDVAKNIVVSTSGGTLACSDGPDPTKSLAHPAIIDWALCEYMIVASQNYKGMSIDKPFNREIGLSILNSAIHKFDTVKWLNMFQNVIASSVGSINYIYGVNPNDPSKFKIMQHYNRVFIMKDGTPDTLHLYAANARIITAATKAKRKRDGESERQPDAMAQRILTLNGVSKYPTDREAVVKKVTNIEDSWYMYIENRALESLSPAETAFIINNIDIDKYLKLLEDCFEKNWRNHIPEIKDPMDDIQMTVEMTHVTSGVQSPITKEILDTDLKKQIYERVFQENIGEDE